jgi:hypothetical protein
MAGPFAVMHSILDFQSWILDSGFERSCVTNTNPKRKRGRATVFPHLHVLRLRFQVPAA